MRYRNLLYVFTFCLLIISCKDNGREFSLEIKNYGGAAGITTYYLVTDRSVQVDEDCDFQYLDYLTLLSD